MKKEDKDLGADAAVVAGAGSIDTDAASHAARFTPGPWNLDYVIDGAFQISGTVRGDACVLATRAPFPSRHFEFAANAHLIAAAPDLYAACQKFVDSFKSLQREKCDVAHAMAVAALAKADGQP